MTAAVDVNPYLGPVDEAVANNFALIHHVAKRYRSAGKTLGLDYEDIVSIGSIGLIKAARNFNPVGKHADNKFSTLAVSCILMEIRRSLTNSARLVKIPRTIIDIINAINHHSLHDHSATDIAKRLSVPVLQVKRALEVMEIKIVSTNKPITSKNGDSVSKLSEAIPKSEDFSVVYVSEFISSLPEREKIAVRLRLQGKTQKQIGQYIGVSQKHAHTVLQKIGSKFEIYLRSEVTLLNG